MNWKNSNRVIEFMWNVLEDVPFDELEKKLVLAEDWLFFPKGTEREEIWLWFDVNYTGGLSALYELDNQMIRNAILVCSDGYSISETVYESVEAAQQNMKEEYEEIYPYEDGETPDEITQLSDLGDMDAILYNRGKDVYLWTIIPLQKSFNMNNWIPVSLGFYPEDSVPVQVTYLGYHDKKPYCDEFAYRADGQWYWRSDDSIPNVQITAWKANCKPYNR